MSDTSALNVRDDVLELAERYEQVAALDPTRGSPIGRSAPGSRLPPGMQEVLDADELHAALALVDEWAEFLVHVLVDECDVSAPDATPARLRMVAANVAHFIEHEDEWLAMSFGDDLHDRLRDMRRLSSRGVRRIRTGMHCQEGGCRGHLVSPLGSSDDRADDALECDRCHAKTPYVVWSSWPRARVKFITVEHAAKLAGTTVGAVKMRASRMHWRRVGTGRDIRYHVDDVRGDTREAAQA